MMILRKRKNGMGTGGIAGEKKGTSWFGADYPACGGLDDF